MDPTSILSSMKKLHVDHKKDNYTTGKAPHKPILLLSLIILQKNNKIDLSDIKPDLYLRETWEDLWRSLEYDKVGPIHLPMYHLRSDGFWRIDLKPGISPHQPKSLSDLMGMSERISLDPDMIRSLEDPSFSNEMVNAILHGGYFSEGEVARLKDRISTLMDSFRYQERIVQEIKDAFKMDHSPEGAVYDMRAIQVRDPAFRRSILEAYDETCAVCGMKLVAHNGVSVNDAAHILPYSRYYNDDIRNGICLCKNHHWLFDRFLLSFDGHYRIVVTKKIETENPENVLTRFNGKDMILPKVAEKYPHPTALEWHRNMMRS
jgi:putative restriction endonuclease